jgi:hypothetical protein
VKILKKYGKKNGFSTKSMGKKAIFTARFTQDAEHAEKKVVKNKIILEVKACQQIEAI